MIVVKEFPNKEFATKDELFAELKANKSTLIAQKKMITKEADATVHCVVVDNEKNANKAQGASDNPTKLKAELVINTTNLLDSHGDVHIKGIWNKSAKESKNILLLQEHRMTFDHIITDKVQASVNEVQWKDLGLNFNGTTEALTFNVEIDKERNPFMFEQYAKGYVNQHSVGMRYVKLELALNSESKYDIEEKAVWDKYYNEIANKEVADEQGYFWAVTEAKIIEGSAVVRGSNYATPTISVEAVKDTLTQQTEPSIDTQALEQLKLIINKI